MILLVLVVAAQAVPPGPWERVDELGSASAREVWWIETSHVAIALDDPPRGEPVSLGCAVDVVLERSELGGQIELDHGSSASIRLLDNALVGGCELELPRGVFSGIVDGVQLTLVDPDGQAVRSFVSEQEGDSEVTVRGVRDEPGVSWQGAVWEVTARLKGRRELALGASETGCVWERTTVSLSERGALRQGVDALCRDPNVGWVGLHVEVTVPLGQEDDEIIVPGAEVQARLQVSETGAVGPVRTSVQRGWGIGVAVLPGHFTLEEDGERLRMRTRRPRQGLVLVPADAEPNWEQVIRAIDGLGDSRQGGRASRAFRGLDAGVMQ